MSETLSQAAQQDEQIVVAAADPTTREYLATGFTARGFTVSVCVSGPQLLEAIRKPKLRLIVMRDDLPDRDATELCTLIRLHCSRAPILLLTQRLEVPFARQALTAGANDLVAPTEPARVFVRAEALIERARGSSESKLRLGPFLVDYLKSRVTVGHERLNLSRGQVQIFWFLCRHAGTVVTLDELVAELSGYAPSSSGRKALTQQVHRLRERLGPWASHIENIRGFGYMLRVPR